MKTRLAEEVMKIYSTFDEAIHPLSERFGIHCPPGCGSCCASPKVEATLLEMLPMAEWILLSPDAEDFLWRLEQTPTPDHCMFYTPDTLHYNHGRCSVYPYRPTLCRLFGFAAVRDKREQAVFAACKFIKQMIPGAVSDVQQYLQAGGEILLFTEAASLVATVEPALDKRYPINQALQQALQKMGMMLQFEALENGDQRDPHFDPSPSPPLKNCS